MPLDTQIPLMVRQPADPMEGYGKAMSLAALAGQNRLQQLQLETAQRDQEATRSIADLYRGAIGADGKLDRAKLTQGLAGSGYGDKLPGLQKTWLETDRAQAELDNARGQIDERSYKLLKQRLDAGNGALASLLSRPNVTHDDVMGALGGLASQGLMKQEEVAAAARGMPSDPTQLRPWLQQKAMEGLEAGKRLELLTPKLEKVNDGQTTRFVDINTWTNPTGPAPIQMQMTPGEQQQARDAAAGRAVTVRGQNLVDARARETAAQGGTVVEKDAAGNFVVVDKRTGTARQVMGADGKPVGTGAAVKDAGEALQLINQAIPLLSQSTGSYGGWAMDRIAQAFGKATDGSIAAGQLKAIEGALVAKMPKMSGPQSDKDVLLYRQMAAEIGNDTVPMERKAAALETLREIQERYAGVAPGGSKPPKAAPPPRGPRQGGADGAWGEQGQAPTWKDAGYASQAAAVQDALNAIQRGAPKAAVIQRLEAAGIKNHGIK